MKILIIGVIGTSLLLNSCSYQNYLGWKYEKENRFEESYEYYRTAYIQSTFKGLYKKNLDRVGVKLVESFKERYYTALEKREFNYAFFLLNSALSIDPEDAEMLAENKDWYRVLVIGKLDIAGRISRNYQKFDQVEVIIDFYSPNQTAPLRVKVDTSSGIFSTEEAIYKPSFSFLSFYYLNKIGLQYYDYEISISEKPKSQSNQQQAQISQSESPIDINARLEYLKLLEFSNVQLSNSDGSLKISSDGVENKVLEDILKNQPPPNENWLFSRSIDYQTSLQDNFINLKTNTSNSAFLPQTIYLNQKDRFFVINFGSMAAQYFNNRSEWGMIRKQLDERDKDLFIKLFENIKFHIFSKYDNPALYYKAE